MPKKYTTSEDFSRSSQFSQSFDFSRSEKFIENPNIVSQDPFVFIFIGATVFINGTGTIGKSNIDAAFLVYQWLDKWAQPVSVIKFVNKSDITIADNGFSNWEDLISIEFINEGKTVFGKNCFNKCLSLQNFTFPSYYTVISSGLFNQCGFTSFSVPEQITKIESSAFRNCKKLVSFRFNENIKEVEENAFFECTNLREVFFCGQQDPANSKRIFTYGQPDNNNNYQSFSERVNFIVSKKYETKTFAEASVVVQSYIVSDRTVVVEAVTNHMISGDQITKNFDSISCKCIRFEAVTILGAEITVKKSAFENYSIKSIMFNNTGETYIKERAFNGCSLLTSVSLPAKLIDIGNSGFEGTAITVVTIPETCQSIGDLSFSNCSSLERVNIIKKLHVGEAAFTWCLKLSKIVYCGDMSPDITSDVFIYLECQGSSCEVKDFADNITVYIQKAKYLNKTFINVKNIEEANKEVNIDNFHFRIDNSSLEVSSNEPGVSIEWSIISKISLISSDVLCACKPSEINKITFSGNDMRVSQNGFSGQTAIEYVVFQNTGEVNIDIRAFSGCLSLRSVKLPDRLIKIDSYAFQGANLVEITIPSQCNIINDRAFEGNTNLRDVHVLGNIRVGDDVFMNCISLKTFIYCSNIPPVKTIPINRLEIFTLTTGSFASQVSIHVQSGYTGSSFCEVINIEKSANSVTYNGVKLVFIQNNLRIEGDSDSVSYRLIRDSVSEIECPCAIEDITDISFSGSLSIAEQGFKDVTHIRSVDL